MRKRGNTVRGRVKLGFRESEVIQCGDEKKKMIKKGQNKKI